MSSASSRLADWLDQRTGFRGLVETHLTGYRLPERNRSWLTLGGLLMFVFGLQIATGILLLFHFAPHPDLAFESLQRIRRDVSFGWLIQGLHGHGGNLMVAAVLIHMLRNAYLGAYKAPREINWITGSALLLLTMGAGLTGYILPWSQISYWATTVVTAAMESAPFVGPELVRLIRGGDAVGAPTFARAFAAHVGLIPLSMIGLIALHLYLLRHHGSAPHPVRKGEPEPDGPSLPFHPDFVVQDGLVVLGFLVLLVSGVVFAPNLFVGPDSFVPANPLDTPPNVKPEWYFLWSYQLLRMFPEVLALILQGIVFGLLFALPFLDRSPHRHPLDRPWVMVGLALAVAALVALTIQGFRA